MGWNATRGAACSIARALGVVGERWTLLILREIFRGSHRFDEIRSALGISRNVLSGRLDALVAAGVLDKVSYQDRPVRFEYQLTAKGRDLYPVLLALLRWGDRWLAEGEQPPLTLIHRGCGKTITPEIACDHCGEPLDPSNTRARLRAPLLTRP
ncbi:MAG: winged helix-turn-helix transcriptional regulator [Myxococcota bacterium]